MVLKKEWNSPMCPKLCAFIWNEVVEKTYALLKHVICNTLVLTMLDFTNIFALECDASKIGLGAILMQYG